MKKFVLYVLCLLVSNGLLAQAKTVNAAKVVAGPMLGYAEQRECLVWIQTSCNKTVTLKYAEINGLSEGEMTLTNKSENPCTPWISKFVLTDLKQNTAYTYEIYLDKKLVNFPYDLRFKTKKTWAEWSKEDAFDLNFLVGSCTYINDSAYDRPGKPYGQVSDIFSKMAEQRADFMLWLGDNTYTREADFSSASGIKYRYLHTRSDASLQKFLSRQNNYAIWDDHDFGENDANKTFDLKDVSKECFVNYWGNKTYGEGGKGIYFSFRQSDAEFFMLDDRTFRDESELDEEKYKTKTQLGEVQLSWLKNKLKHSAATFKFIVVGGQFLNTETNKESFNLYKRERAEIIKFIAEQKISGVMFLTGDRHHTELLKYEPNSQPDYVCSYPMYDLTSSALTAGPSNILKTKEAENPFRVQNTLVAENNYCGIKITGARGNRSVQITCYDKGGIVKWTHTINETVLKAK
ncbi:MAG: alkaline phosphatase family protein [Bacteroidia bacterium]|nr:alkaline phosphatase family protein [Bacteroidia bacterium]